MGERKNPDAAFVKTLEILTPGPLTSVQDLGRHGYGRYGVPPSGGLDTFSLRAANLLAGNPEGEACLEITMTGFRAKILTELLIAVTGADLHPTLNDLALTMWQAHPAKAGDILSFKGLESGCRAYLALGGGIRIEPVMGSKSTNLACAFGGYEGRTLRRGDTLFSQSPSFHLGRAGTSLRADRIPKYGKECLLRVLPGPQHEDFPRETMDRFLSSSYMVTPQSDRTGIRLSGPPLRQMTGLAESIVSEGVAPGAIQVPGDAQPIILLVETVTGGYRKLAAVISADLPLLGQMKPGDVVRFEEVSKAASLKALRDTEEILGSLR